MAASDEPPPAPARTVGTLRRAVWKALCSPLGLLVVLVLYSFLGAAVFRTVEGPHEQREKLELLELREEVTESMWNTSHAFKNRAKFAALVQRELRKYEAQLYTAYSHGINTGAEDSVWSFWGAMVYSATIYTTIGYGHIAPATDAGRLVTMLYALVGIPLCLIVLAELGKLLTLALKVMWAFPRRLYFTGSCAADPRYPVDGEFDLPPAVAVLVTAVYIVGGAAMYCQWEDWGYLEAFYFIFISISTVGFGDVLPSHPKFFLLSFAYQLFGLALVAMVINVIMERLSIHLERAGKSVAEASRSIGIDLVPEEEQEEVKGKTE